MNYYQFVGVLILMLTAIIITLTIIYRKTYFVKITYKYGIILIPAIILVVTKLFSMKKTPQADSNTQNKPNLIQALDEVQARITEAQQTTIIEVTSAREENKVKLDELKKVTQIEDDNERRKRIAELMG